MISHYYTVIMAGGVGSRFWPLSKQKYPKQFLDVLNTGKTLFQSTYDRFLQVCPKENIFVVANKDYVSIIRDQIPDIPVDRILSEPLARNTAPCIAYAVHKIAQTDPEASIVVSPSDHLILNEKLFIDSILKSLNFVSERNILLTLGITPNRPDTGYGYIQFDDTNHEEGIYKVKTFTEKPPLEIAKQFVKSGEFLWNAGIFIWNVKSILEAFKKHLPEVDECFSLGKDIYFSEKEEEEIAKAYSKCTSVSIDYGIMEKASNVYVLPGNFGWSDIGTWNSLFEYVKKDGNNNHVKGKYVFTRNASNCIIKISDDKLLAVNNVSDLIIVESDNIILVADRNQEQDIRNLVNEIKSKYRDKFI
ncbi:MAG TPA: mannose-1-phosphate guanylyltransferase [Bacteroidia bacterium]|nr:NTP transferase domain-containing protein [Sphingobacteriales bacterium]HPD66286.1 mannose-1-phosphate guanylyltransferase [Bacteroidia bacterium]HRS59933.1 mannose-1-phosphate guanylyltransferase [Bacteroidia bacterium]HRU68700.1 mannose-1-phosphate guanylyltransferase [Bacteroidia bacterium]